jgi:hypothetical protein
MKKQEAEVLAHLIHDHMKREEKELKKLLHIDDLLSVAVQEEEIESLQSWRESQRKKAMKHREWLKEIAPLLDCTVKSFRGRGHDKKTGIKRVVPTVFEEWG